MKTDTKKNLNFLKILSVDMIDAAKAGYPGISLGASSIIYTLFTEHLNIMPSNPDWLNHDRLVLSAAHASGLVYANMYMAGFDITLDDLKNFGKPNSKTPILNDMLKTKGIDMTTGPAGYGFSAAIGMAMGEKYYAVFLPRRSAIASTSWIGKLVILAVKAIEAPSFKAFSAILTVLS